MLCTTDIHKLITYCTIVETFFITLSVTGLLYMRWKRPDIKRPIKTNIAIPVLFVLLCVFLMALPCVEAPFEVGMGVLITASGIPAYYAGVCWQDKPDWFQNFMSKFNELVKVCTYCNVQIAFQEN